MNVTSFAIVYFSDVPNLEELAQKLITDDSSPINVSSYPCGVCHPIELQRTAPSH